MPSADPSLSIAERIDTACDRFESEWKSGRRPRIDDYLAAAPESDREQLRSALVAIARELASRSATDTAAARSSVRSADKANPVVTTAYVGGSAALPTAVGRFQIRGVLGAGSFGKVYRAFDPQLGREVALKVPLESAVQTDVERNQFLKEARSAATINHPNICQIHEVGEHDGRPYIVMALVPGQSLADSLQARKEPLPQKQVALIVRKVALALEAAHDKGIVHRDLKPANIMFDRERKDIVVMDFGLARGPRLGNVRATQSGVVMGTPAYMSPEQARGDSKGVGPAGDVFSLGVILYELLTGTRPFAGTATEVIGKILHVEPEPPSTRRPGIDRRLEVICLKAMAKAPAKRYATMKEFAAALDVFLRATPPAQPATETAQAETTRPNTEPAGTGTVAAVVAALSAERRQAQTETAALVETALAKHRTPRWLFALLALLLLGGLTALAGIVFFTRSDKVKVTIELTGVDLSDKTLSFFLDGEPISSEALAKPVELSPGEHELLVKRGKEVVKRMRLTVTGGRSPGVKLKDVTHSGEEESGQPDGTPEGWKGLELVKTLPHQYPVLDALFSPDGSQLWTTESNSASGKVAHVYLWDVKTWKQVRDPAAIAGDIEILVGKLAAGGGKIVFGVDAGRSHLTELVVWSPAKWAPETRFAFAGNQLGVFVTLEVSRDGKTILGSRYNGNGNVTRLFEATTGETRLEVKGWASCFVPEKDKSATTILVADGNEIRQIELATEKVVRTLRKHREPIRCLTISRDGRFAASASGSSVNELLLWDLRAEDGAPVLLGKHKVFLSCLAFSPSGKYLLSGSSEGVLKLWDVVERKEVAAVRADKTSLHSVRFSPDGKLAVTGGSEAKAAKVWKLTK